MTFNRFEYLQLERVSSDKPMDVNEPIKRFDWKGFSMSMAVFFTFAFIDDNERSISMQRDLFMGAPDPLRKATDH